MVASSCLEKEVVVTGLAHDYEIAKIGIFDVPDEPGVADKIFTSLAKEKINVDMIVQSAMRNKRNDIAFTIPKDDLGKALETIKRVGQEIKFSETVFSDSVAKISIVGAGMITSPGVAAKMFSTLAAANVNLEMISTSEIKVSCVIKKEGVERALQALHTAFELDGE